METAKVDIRKLQTLSDCINRTIEALNQVRLSVHAGNLPYAQLGLQGAGAAFGAYPGAFGIAPQLMGQVPGVIPGIAHSAAQNALFNQIAGVSPWANLAQLGNIAQQAAQQAAFANTPWNNASAAFNTTGLNGNPFAQQFGQTGLAHTGVDQRFNNINGLNGLNAFNGVFGNEFVDPYAQARIAQTFPFVHWGYSPFGWPTV